MSNWKLSPSDFGFLYKECKRCFYLKVVHGYAQPRMPMPKVFNIIDLQLKKFFQGKRLEDVVPQLPAGIVKFGDIWVESTPIRFEGIEDTCYIKGRLDSFVRFDEGGYGVIDFKFSTPGSNHVPIYGTQLGSYAYALENAASGSPSFKPITKTGLLIIEPKEIGRSIASGAYYFKTDPQWIETPRDDKLFLGFLREVVDLLSKPEIPPADPKCKWCQYRERARENKL